LDLTDTAEIIGIVRDVAFLLLLVIAILALLIIYRKVSKVLDSAKRIIEGAEDIVTTVANKVVAPAAAGSGLAFGTGKAAAFLLGLTRRKKSNRKRKGGRNDGE